MKLSKLKHLRDLLLIVTSLILMTGCALKMPLSPENPVTLREKDGLAVFTMTLKNEFKNYLLTPSRIFVKAAPINGGKTLEFAFSDPEQRVSDRELKKLASFNLPPGDYRITHFTGQTDVGFMILPVTGRFEPSFKKHFRIAEGEAVYLGNVMARLVERTNDDEERAGPVFPLVDQAATGISTGTFKFEVSDRSDEDINYIKTRFPAVSGRQFTKRLLSDFKYSTTEGEAVATETVTVNHPTSEAGNPANGNSDKKGSTPVNADRCSVTQILEMKRLGLSDKQIKQSCS